MDENISSIMLQTCTIRIQSETDAGSLIRLKQIQFSAFLNADSFLWAGINVLTKKE